MPLEITNGLTTHIFRLSKERKILFINVITERTRKCQKQLKD